MEIEIGGADVREGFLRNPCQLHAIHVYVTGEEKRNTNNEKLVGFCAKT